MPVPTSMSSGTQTNASGVGEHGDLPALPTPSRTGAAFSFPYDAPYSIQLDLMVNLFEAIEQRKVAVFESPTGTGKSLSLICGAFTWLKANEARLRENPEGLSSDTGDDDEPEWVKRQAAQRRMKELWRGEEELNARIKAMQRREDELRKKAARTAADRTSSSRGLTNGNKRQKQTHSSRGDGETESDDEAFLPAPDQEQKPPSWHSISALNGSPQGPEEMDNLSPAVRALMSQFSSSTSSNRQEDEIPETKPKIIYVSRTHSQLSQFVAELRKTAFGRRVIIDHCGAHPDVAEVQAASGTPIRTIALGSRKQMCINERVQDIGTSAGPQAMNEACRELHSNQGSRKRCEYLPPMDELGRARMLDFRDRAMTTVRDIEDLVSVGKEMATCPYYAARTSARQAQLVTMPYNLLLQKTARESLGISLADSVVLIDESHNLIDTILSVHTCTITSSRITIAKEQIDEYLRRFGGRMRGESEVMLRVLQRLLSGLETLCTKWRGAHKPATEEVWTASRIVAEMGANLDTVNFGQLEHFLRTTQIARKVSGYAERCILRRQRDERTPQPQQRSKAMPSAITAAPSAITAMHAIETFLMSLGNRTEDGRVLLNFASSPTHTQKGAAAMPPGSQSEPDVQLKYQLLSPSECFRDVVEQARAVIMAGGTMEPISDIRHQLFPTLSADRWTTHSCSHIVPSSNLLCSVVPSGPRGVPFEFKFDKRGDQATMDDLGNAVANIITVVPHGVVVFLPSYQFLDEVQARWQSTGLWQRLAGRKHIFAEPRASTDVDGVLQAYSTAMEDRSGSLQTGSLLLAVVGAKLSEGINFSDRLARAVVMVGMPFPNSHSAELKERMRHVRQLAGQQGGDGGGRADAGQELYVNLCMKAVNQSIGRAIRHQNDFAALILLDSRYGRGDIMRRLPGWIKGETKVQANFGGLIKDVGAFFRDKRAKGML
ncbi:unnamed protein product [Parajaminaea phylloscopi]